MDKNQSGATTPGLSEPGSDGCKRLLRTETSPSDCLVSYPGHLFVGSPTPLHRSRCIQQSQPTEQPLNCVQIKLLLFAMLETTSLDANKELVLN